MPVGKLCGRSNASSFRIRSAKDAVYWKADKEFVMYFKPYYLGCLAHASYLIGGDSGEAAVIDPRRDVDEYIQDAVAAGLQIKHVIETHLHADFVSGHVELARRTGATIYIGAAAEAAFCHHPVCEGDAIVMGDVTLRFLETPGHTPESICVLLFVGGEAKPRMVFTGDTLFIGDVGRPDLVGSKGFTAEEMARQMYRSLADKLLSLPDSTEVWPAHGAGSACGRALADERSSTLARERAFNPALRYVIEGDEESFVRYAISGLPPVPAYFAQSALENRLGAPSVEEVVSAARALAPPEVEELSEEGILVLDTRSVEAFGAGHVPGAIHVQLEGKFAPWVGNVVPPGSTVIVVAEPGRELEAMTRLARVGYERIVGWLEGGMEAWRKAGGEVIIVRQVTPEELRQMMATGTAPAILDVRAADEWEASHLPGAQWIPLPELPSRVEEVDQADVLVLCGSGYRSSIACSLLQRAGYRNVMNLAGGWEAWEQTQRIPPEKKRVTAR
jgi:hydroxyacylglutathione hydrolase